MELAVVEGFFGRPWSFPEREAFMRALAPEGYRLHIYAPKADAFLRRRWREPHPAAEAAQLSAFGAACRSAGVRFVLGLSPFELHFGFDAEGRAALADKLAALADLGPDGLAIFFDDMRGDLADLARRQAEIVAFAAERAPGARLLVCPSYYSDDPVLDRVFGRRPPGYLEDLGAALDPAIAVMWTGEEVCSREFSAAHLERVADALRRPPYLWDNYPVNDGPRMSRRLHLRAFTGRPAHLAGLVEGHAVNPALQPTLSRIPLLTLAWRYRDEADWAYGAALARAARAVCGPALGDRLLADLLALEDEGLGGLSPERRTRLTEVYDGFDHPAAREVAAFLRGAYTATTEEVLTQ